MVNFIVGLIVGCAVGVCVAALCQAASAPAEQPVEKFEQLAAAEKPKGADEVAPVLGASITDLTAECPTISISETVGRAECLSRALTCVCGERETDYGSPEDSFGKIAALWSAYRGETYTAQDVAVMMALLKIARIGGGRATVDSWVDLAGYAACGCELSTRETET